jgi:hypothetical protein
MKAANTTVRSVLVIIVALTGCVDVRSTPKLGSPAQSARFDAIKLRHDIATARWNVRGTALVGPRPPANAQAAVSQILTYLSVAHYRAVLATESGEVESIHPSLAAAVGAVNASVLGSFFSSDLAAIEAQVTTGLAGPAWPGVDHQDVLSGPAIGRGVASSVLALAATDYLVHSPGLPQVGPRYRVANGLPVRSLYGVRPFFLTSRDRLRAPPVFGSAAAALSRFGELE